MMDGRMAFDPAALDVVLVTGSMVYLLSIVFSFPSDTGRRNNSRQLNSADKSCKFLSSFSVN